MLAFHTINKPFIMSAASQSLRKFSTESGKLPYFRKLIQSRVESSIFHNYWNIGKTMSHSDQIDFFNNRYFWPIQDDLNSRGFITSYTAFQQNVYDHELQNDTGYRREFTFKFDVAIPKVKPIEIKIKKIDVDGFTKEFNIVDLLKKRESKLEEINKIVDTYIEYANNFFALNTGKNDEYVFNMKLPPELELSVRNRLCRAGYDANFYFPFTFNEDDPNLKNTLKDIFEDCSVTLKKS